jgi:hypothetical protein
MISIYPTQIEAVDEDHNILFTLTMFDFHACEMKIEKSLVMDNSSVEDVLDAVRKGVKMLNLRND